MSVEATMLKALACRYTAVRPGTTADRYVRSSHVRICDERGDLARRIADYLVLDTYGPTVLHGFEVKVSRSDWLAELRDPAKAAAMARFCDRWWLVVPDRAIVRGDLPAEWGLLAPDAAGRLRAVVSAPPRRREPMPAPVLAQWTRAIQRTAARATAARDLEENR